MSASTCDPRDLPSRHDYEAAKNSFIVQRFRRGERRTLLELAGCGSVRHLWSTWYGSFDQETGVEPDRVLLRAYVDGEQSPSVEGTIDALCAAAEATGERYATQPAFNWEGSFNLYLPIFFSGGLRLEAEALDDLDEYYAQIDYRITMQPETEARLVSAGSGKDLRLEYVGPAPPAPPESVAMPPSQTERLDLAPGAEGQVVIEGPATLHELAFRGAGVEDLQLFIHWDDQPSPAVAAPLRYLFADFRNTMLDATPGLLTTRIPMPFRRSARIRLGNPTSGRRSIEVRYAADRTAHVDATTRYFHAAFTESSGTTGFEDLRLLDVRGEGHFVGITLFDSGHNHGGGDTALIDAETEAPRVLHGICGEDYFSFAWHKAGRMHGLAGAPAHERRYRLHLENPYPFGSSLSFRFGCFAGQKPKGVAFWYQRPEPPATGSWLAPTVPWKVFGPAAPGDELPTVVDHRSRETVVALAKPERFAVRWEDVTMLSGFLDLTHHYRRFLMAEAGTGFVGGECRTRALIWIDSPAERTLSALIGHDDPVHISLNGAVATTLAGRMGFAASPLKLPLRQGRNELSVVIENTENVNWRWHGISLALRMDDGLLDGVRFSSSPEA
jgi:DUF2961 family protein